MHHSQPKTMPKELRPVARPVPGRPRLAACGQRRGFTLIELILVMAMLAIVMALAAPTLSSFFKGRVLDTEARRLLALTRHGQSQAISEGIPVLLWMNPGEGTYGLRTDASYESRQRRGQRLDTNRFSFVLAERIRLSFSAPMLGAEGAQNLAMNTGTQPGYIRFLPDGFIDATSPYQIVLQEDGDGVRMLSQTVHRRYYEIHDPSNPTTLR